jgi:putative hydrolase of the HAD superfamily
MSTIRTIAFDGDDTLWHSESYFEATHAQFRALLAPHVAGEVIDRTLIETESRNLRLFGYGVKGYVLSMIETAIELTEGRIPAADIRTLLDFGKTMLDHPVELIDGVIGVLDALGDRYRLMVITKGDLFHQETKVARSGIAERFDRIEIVAEKDEATYRRILSRVSEAPDRFLMVGNSMRSDILPVLDLGGQAVHVPYRITWAHEEAAEPRHKPPGFYAIGDIAELPGLLALIDGAAA